MAKITLLLGGVRSGKSDHAQEIACTYGDNVIYYVTGKPVDAEMSARIKAHQATRPSSWKTIELEETELVKRIVNDSFDGCYVLDCLTIYVANLMQLDDARIYRHLDDLAAAVKGADGHMVIVSNEVGMGVVPASYDGRRYRDLLGKANQVFAKAADEAFLMVAGLRTQLK